MFLLFVFVFARQIKSNKNPFEEFTAELNVVFKRISLIIFFQWWFSTDWPLTLSVGNVLSPSAIHVHIYWIPSRWDQSFSHQRSITNGNIRMAL